MGGGGVGGVGVGGVGGGGWNPAVSSSFCFKQHRLASTAAAAGLILLSLVLRISAI